MNKNRNIFFVSLLVVLVGIIIAIVGGVTSKISRKNAYEYLEEYNSHIEYKANPLRFKFTVSDESDNDAVALQDGKEYKKIYYNAHADNRTGYEIMDWHADIIVPEDMYIKSFGEGRLKISQNGGRHVQTINQYILWSENLMLDYVKTQDSIYIPLYKGDVITYYPSNAAEEERLVNKQSVDITFGFLIPGESDVVFNNFVVTYKLKYGFFDMPEAPIIVGMGVLWLALVIFILAVIIKNRRTFKANEKEKKMLDEAISTFVDYVDSKDGVTFGHSKRVAKYSEMIASKLGLSDEEQFKVYYSALLHDAGKVSIPEEILRKPGKLTDLEFDIIKSHTTKGAAMLADFSSLPDALDVARYHHERYDGDGYPDGLKGEDIPLMARIVCVTDAFDAMNSNRVYRKALTKDYIINELRINANRQFDAKIVEIFVEIIENEKLVLD